MGEWGGEGRLGGLTELRVRQHLGKRTLGYGVQGLSFLTTMLVSLASLVSGQAGTEVA